MGLLADQDAVSKKTPMPVNDVTVSTDKIPVANAAVAFYYSNAGVRTVDAGQVAGVAVTIELDKAPIYNTEGTQVGDHKDSSFAFAATDTFDVEVGMNTNDYKYLQKNGVYSWLDKLTALTTNPDGTTLSNGEYKVDYVNGTVYGIKKDADTTESITYWSRGFQVVVTSSGGVASGSPSYTEDVGAPAAIVGTATMFERDDIITTLTPVAGDWASMRCSAEGALWTQDFNSDAILSDTTAIKTAVQIIDNSIYTDNGAGTATPVVSMAGAHYKATLDTYSDNDAVTLHADINGLLKVASTPSASAESAPSTVRLTDLDETPAQAVKASAGNVYGWNFYNPNGYDVFVKFYNTASGSVTVGSTAVVETVHVPGLDSVVIKTETPIKSFSTAISIAATKLVADADTTALDSDIFAHVYYK